MSHEEKGKINEETPHYLFKEIKLGSNSNLINLIWGTPTGFSHIQLQLFS